MKTPMKYPRNSLSAYYGQYVVLEGYYNNYLHYDKVCDCFIINPPVKFIFNEQGGIRPNNVQNYKMPLKKEDMFGLLPNIPAILPIQDVGTSRILLNVRGLGQYSEICEHHIRLYCNCDGRVSIGSKVVLWGRVGQYVDTNKQGGYDYCIDDIVYIK